MEQLGAALDRLAGSGLICCDAEPPAAAYSFRHALVQEAAYSSLLKSKRRKLHARVASTVEGRFPEVVELRPEWLAHHYTEAGQAETRGRALAESGAARQGRLREQGGTIPSRPMPGLRSRRNGGRTAGLPRTWTGKSWTRWSCSATW